MRLDLIRFPVLTAASSFLLLAVATLNASASPPPAFKIYVDDPGVYRVTFEDLQQAGLAVDEVLDPQRLSLTQGGEEVPIWVEAGDDEGFGPGDYVEFLGEHLAGEQSYYSPYTRLNVYRLRVAETDGQRITVPAKPAGGIPKKPALWAHEQHLERDRIKEVFARPDEDHPEVWFWMRLTHVDPEPFQLPLHFRSFQPDPERPTRLTVQLQGSSAAARTIPGVPDHRVEVYLNGVLVGEGEWDGEDAYRIESEITPDVARRGENLLEIKVPERHREGYAMSIIDAVTLNWIEVRHARGYRLGPVQVRLALDGGSPSTSSNWARLTTDPGARVTVYSASGSRFDGRNMVSKDHGDRSSHDFYPPADETVMWAVPEGSSLPPVALELDTPDALRDSSRQADYIVITHPGLRAPIEPLVEFHRQRGLNVAVVEVDDIYDEFNHSLLDPASIREFLSYAYHQWQPPKPRFVLLVGDAGWRAERSHFSAELTAVDDPEAAPPNRNLVPTGTFVSYKGNAASDNYYVAVDGDDHLPDMAIGRLPAVTVEELETIVDKTLRYAAQTEIGPWRREILWVSSGDSEMRGRSDQAVEEFDERGFDLRRFYPPLEVEPNEQSQDGLQAALNRGQLLVHFLGHGGRYVWRTGITSFLTTLDLFTMEHVEQLQPNPRLPMVLSMTCYTGSFDHPTADSFGELLLRLPDRGAVAFLGASWKIRVDPYLSGLLLEELTIPGTIGEAVQRVKRRVLSPSPVAIYNLLGDPALELALPELALDITAEGGESEGWEIAAQVPGSDFAGRAVVDWLDGGGEVVHSEELEVRAATVTAELEAEASAEVVEVRVYVWNGEAGVDGIGALQLAADPGPAEEVEVAVARR